MHTSSSKRSRSVIVVSIIVVSVACMIVIRHRTAPADRSARDADAATPSGEVGARATREQLAQADRTGRLRHRIAALESDVTALRNEKAVVSPHGASALDRQDGTGKPAQLSEAEMQAQRKQEEDRIFSQIGRSFSAQSVDPAWAASMAGRINDHMRAHLEHSNVENVDCRSSACRVEISLRAGADLSTIRDDFRSRMADVLGTGAIKQDDTGRFIIYLAKDPQALGITTQP